MPLSAGRKTKTAFLGLRSFPVADNVVIFEGALVAIDTSGYARPARATATDKVVGIADTGGAGSVDNTVVGHAAGAVRVNVRDDRPAYMVSATGGGDPITFDDIGADCYAVDDFTVALTNGSSARPRAGKIYLVDADGVAVRFDQ